MQRPKMKKVAADRKGFTLVEVLTAFTLIVIVISALSASLAQSMIFSKRLDIIYVSSYLAQRRIDLLKRFDFDGLYPAGLENRVRLNAAGNIDPNGEYMRTTEVDENYKGNPYLTKITITVYRIKINMDGSIIDPVTGNVAFMSTPVVMETVFADVK
jgi:type II secretory pathway pseudopilin PulG